MGLLLVVPAIVIATALGVAAELRFRERAERACDRGLLIALYAVMPVIVFFNVARLEFTTDVGFGILLGYVAATSVGVVAWLIGRRRWSRSVTGTVMVSAIAGNTAYLGYPFVTILLGADQLPEAVAYDALVSVPTLVIGCFAIGAAFGEEAGESPRDRGFAFLTRNPLLPAFALALVVPDALAPDILVTASHVLVFAILPVGFFAVGVYLAATSPGRFSLPRLDDRVAVAIVLKMALLPSILYLTAAALIDIPAPYLLLAAMPCGLNTLIVANAYGLDRRLAAGAIAWSTALALVAAGVAAAFGMGPAS